MRRAEFMAFTMLYPRALPANERRTRSRIPNRRPAGSETVTLTVDSPSSIVDLFVARSDPIGKGEENDSDDADCVFCVCRDGLLGGRGLIANATGNH